MSGWASCMNDMKQGSWLAPTFRKGDNLTDI